MDKPTPKEIEKFLEVVDKLDRFECLQRTIRGAGAGISPMPVPEVVKTIAWLKDQAR